MTKTPLSRPNRLARLRTLPDWLGERLGLTLERRTATVVEMLRASTADSAAYWLQLLIAMGIATLGLVLGSTAVVIGAMLISPLMGPIVALGMGLGVGSPVLVVRAAGRVGASVLVVVGLASAGVRALPFHAVTNEISARTSPNALDLLIAMFCAVSAVYTTVRGTRDAAAAAAGTAVGIALVPPLCVIGYGLGSGSGTIALGSTLLFTANFCAILLIAVLAFGALGFGSVDIATVEQDTLAAGRATIMRPVVGALHRALSSRYGALLRFVLPAVFVGAVFVPLRSALSVLAWEVRVRTSIDQMLAKLPTETVRSTLTLQGREVSLRLLVVGSAADAHKLQSDLAREITAIAGTTPRVVVSAVPDQRTMQALAASLAAPPPVAATPEKVDVTAARAAILDALLRRWPGDAGTPVDTHLTLGPSDLTDLEVVRVGAPLPVDVVQRLSIGLSAELGLPVRIVDTAFPEGASEASPRQLSAWLTSTLVTLGRLAAEPKLAACIRVPAAAQPGAERDTEGALKALRAALPPSGEIRQRGEVWSLSVRVAPCVTDADGGAPVDGGAADAGP